MTIDQLKASIIHHEIQLEDLRKKRAAVEYKIQCYEFVVAELRQQLKTAEDNSPCG